jgi:Uma2 family endonuclease
MPASFPVTTIDELMALPDDGMRHELLDGRHVVTPASRPDHERVVRALDITLRASLAGHSRLELFSGPADIRLGSRTLVQPDLFVIRNPESGPIQDWSDAPVPLLAIEVLSPSTAARDRGTKRKLYLEAGVAEYWIVDIDARLIERWRTRDERPEINDGMMRWELETGVAGEINVTELFETRG